MADKGKCCRTLEAHRPKKVWRRMVWSVTFFDPGSSVLVTRLLPLKTLMLQRSVVKDRCRAAKLSTRYDLPSITNFTAWWTKAIHGCRVEATVLLLLVSPCYIIHIIYNIYDIGAVHRNPNWRLERDKTVLDHRRSPDGQKNRKDPACEKDFPRRIFRGVYRAHDSASKGSEHAFSRFSWSFWRHRDAFQIYCRWRTHQKNNAFKPCPVGCNHRLRRGAVAIFLWLDLCVWCASGHIRLDREKAL